MVPFSAVTGAADGLHASGQSVLALPHVAGGLASDTVNIHTQADPTPRWSTSLVPT